MNRRGRIEAVRETAGAYAERPEPCWRCAARGPCRHRQVDDVQLPPFSRRTVSDALMGNKNNSPWGKHGNPSGPARDRMLAALKARLKPLAKVDDE